MFVTFLLVFVAVTAYYAGRRLYRDDKTHPTTKQ